MPDLIVTKPCGCVEIYYEEPYSLSLFPHMRGTEKNFVESAEYCFKHSMLRRWQKEYIKESPVRVEIPCGCVIYEDKNDLCKSCTEREKQRHESLKKFKRDQKPEKIHWTYP